MPEERLDFVDMQLDYNLGTNPDQDIQLALLTQGTSLIVH